MEDRAARSKTRSLSGRRRRRPPLLAAGAFDREIVPSAHPQEGKGAEPVLFAKDESPRRSDVDAGRGSPWLADGVSKGRAASRPVTARRLHRSSASGVLVASEEVVRAHGLEAARARRRARHGRGTRTAMGEGPIPAREPRHSRAAALEGQGSRPRPGSAEHVRLAGALGLHPGTRAQPRARQRQRRRHRPRASDRLERRSRARIAALGDEGPGSQARHGRAQASASGRGSRWLSSAEGLSLSEPSMAHPAEHPYASFVHLVQKPARYPGGEFGARAQGTGMPWRRASAWRSPMSTTSG